MLNTADTDSISRTEKTITITNSSHLKAAQHILGYIICLLSADTYYMSGGKGNGCGPNSGPNTTNIIGVLGHKLTPAKFIPSNQYLKETHL